MYIKQNKLHVKQRIYYYIGVITDITYILLKNKNSNEKRTFFENFDFDEHNIHR